MVACAVVIMLLLAAAPASHANVQAAGSVQSAQKTSNTQKSQSTQLFGLPPLPVVLGAAGAALKARSPIRINTRIVMDRPAEQQQHLYGQSYYQAVASDDQAVSSNDTQQFAQYVSSGEATGTGSVQPAPAVQAGQADNAATGSGYWIQNPDGTRTPLSDNDPILLKLPIRPAATAPVATGQIISGSIVAGTVTPVTTRPTQQGSWAVDSQNDTMSNVTWSSSNDSPADTSGSYKVVQGPTIVPMPIYQPQQQQPQVWSSVSQGSQVVQGYYPTKSKGAGMIVVSQPGSAVGYGTVGSTTGPMYGSTAGPMVQTRQSWGVAKGNMGSTTGSWGAGGMSSGGNMSQGMGQNVGQMQQGWGQVQMGQGNMGQGSTAWSQGQNQIQAGMGQGNMGQGMGQMGQGGMGQGNMGWGSSSDAMGASQQQQQQQQQQQGGAWGQPPIGTAPIRNRPMPSIREDPTVIVADDTQQDNDSNSMGNNNMKFGSSAPQPAMGRPGPMPGPQNPSTGMRPNLGMGPQLSGMGSMQQPGFKVGAGGPLNRRPPTMIPINPQQGTRDPGMGEGR